MWSYRSHMCKQSVSNGYCARACSYFCSPTFIGPVAFVSVMALLCKLVCCDSYHGCAVTAAEFLTMRLVSPLHSSQVIWAYPGHLVAVTAHTGQVADMHALILSLKRPRNCSVQQLDCKTRGVSDMRVLLKLTMSRVQSLVLFFHASCWHASLRICTTSTCTTPQAATVASAKAQHSFGLQTSSMFVHCKTHCV
jgi:hypothetical protein